MKHLDKKHIRNGRPEGRYPKHHHPHHLHYGIGQELVHSQSLLKNLRILFKSDTDLDWATREATKEGPPHKQVRNAIILGQLSKVIQILGVESVPFKTVPVIGTNPRDEGFQYPIELPAEVLEMSEEQDIEDVLAWVGDGPAHEVAMDLILINGLAAIIKGCKTNEIITNPKSADNEKSQ